MTVIEQLGKKQERNLINMDAEYPLDYIPAQQKTKKVIGGVVISGDSREKTITVQIDGNVTGVMIGSKISVILP
jgi:hypothetical protein